MRTITRLLENRGATIIGTALASSQWDRDPRFLIALKQCDAILINGEGTFHHGNHRAEHLLKIVDHPLRKEKPVSIVNALYQSNPVEWSRYLDKVNMIIARDGNSYRELRNAFGGKIFRALDLSLHEPDTSHVSDRRGISFGDSVFPSVSHQMLMMSTTIKESTFLPIMRTIKSRKANLPRAVRPLRNAYIYLHSIAYRSLYHNIRFAKNESEFIDFLARSRMHITGRFHGVCFCLLTGTPFLSVTSNSWKIETLLEDVGLSQHRIVRPDSLDEQVLNDLTMNFSYGEQNNIMRAIEENRRVIENAFDQIVFGTV